MFAPKLAPATTLVLTDFARLVTLSVKDVSTDVTTVSPVLLDTTSWARPVSRLATPTCLLTTLPTFVSSAETNVNLAAASPSAPNVPILRPSQSTVSATIAHTLATHALPRHPPVPLVLLDSTSSEPPALLPAQPTPTLKMVSVSADLESSSATSVCQAALLNTVTLPASARSVMPTVLAVMALRAFVAHA